MIRRSYLVIDMDKRINADAIVVDGDNTLWKGRVASGIAIAYMIRSAKELDFTTLMAGLRGARRVEKVVRANGANGDSEGLKEFYRILIDNGIGTRREMLDYAREYIRKHQIKPVIEFLRDHRIWSHVFLSTIGGSTGAMAACELFSVYLGAANVDLFKDGYLTGVEIVVRNGDQKLAATVKTLDRAGLRIDRCIMVGDSEGDIPLLKAAKYRFASPLATDAVKRIPGIVQIRS